MKNQLQIIENKKEICEKSSEMMLAKNTYQSTAPCFLTQKFVSCGRDPYDTEVFYYISDIHVEHRLIREKVAPSEYISTAKKYGRELVCDRLINDSHGFKRTVVLFLGDTCCCVEIGEAFYAGFMDELKLRLCEREKLQLIRDLDVSRERLEMLKSLNDKWYKEWKFMFPNASKKKEVVNEKNQEILRLQTTILSMQKRLEDPIQVAIDSNVLVMSVLGNHELWGFKSLSECMEIHESGKFGTQTYNTLDSCKKVYGDMFARLGIKFLNNCAFRINNVIIVGGTGYAGHNLYFNAGDGIYRGTVNVEQEELESSEFEKVYQKYINGQFIANKDFPNPNQSFVIVVVTHNPIGDWKSDGNPDSGVVYFNGHTHKNAVITDEYNGIYIFSGNQIGYEKTNVNLDRVSIYKQNNPFVGFTDGVYDIVPTDYELFLQYMGEYRKIDNICKRVLMGDRLYMIKRKGYYGFFLISKKRAYICNGGQLRRVEKEADIDFFDRNFLDVVNRYKLAMAPYRKAQEQISDYVKSFGGCGTIHGSIVDIDFCCHVMLNPLDGKITFYFSPFMGEICSYDTLQDLLAAHCKELACVHKQMIKGSENNPDISSFVLQNFKGTDITDGLQKIDIANSPYALSMRLNKFQALFDGRNVLREWPNIDANYSSELVSVSKSISTTV